jgi:Carboxypeptidase regulatory-like domain
MLTKLAVALVLLGGARFSLTQTSSGALQGQVTDPSGAAIPAASVSLTGPAWAVPPVVTDSQGKYRIENLPPGAYSVRITGRGFAPLERRDITIATGRLQTLNAQIQIPQQSQKVTISGEASQLGIDASQSAGQLVLRGSDLDAFSDDPDDLANELQMLAGPAAGPDGGQIFIDGFSDGILPPKASIREIRVNSNPFSTEYDRIGFGRVEVFTKPGSQKFHGQGSYDFGDRALTARNPFVIGIVPNYRSEISAVSYRKKQAFLLTWIAASPMRTRCWAIRRSMPR